MLARVRSYTITPARYERVVLLALGALTVIVFTGAAVRLTGSGLGCPDWPTCGGGIVAPLETHAMIEFGNRVLSGLVGVAAAAAGLLAFRRRPFRRDLAVIGLLLPAGVLAQAVLGGFTVRNELAPGYVMAHYLLSMACLAAAVALAWRAGREPEQRVPSGDRVSVLATRALVPIAGLVVVLGTITTASGPHPGSPGGDVPVHRLDFKGYDTLDWMYHQHGRAGTLLGLSAVVVYLLLRRRGAARRVRQPVVVLACFVGAQGVVGLSQWQLNLPAGLVWVHVVLATGIWLSALWACAVAGPLPRRAAAGERLAPRAAGYDLR